MAVEKASLAKAGGSKEGAQNWSRDLAPSLPSCTSGLGLALPALQIAKCTGRWERPDFAARKLAVGA